MAFFTDPCSKLERAVRQLFILKGLNQDYPNTDIYLGHYEGSRAAPSRSIIVSQFDPDHPHVPEGVCHLKIWHSLSAVRQPTEMMGEQRQAMDNYVGDTIDLLNMGGINTDQDNSVLADAITQAGRWLATPDPNQTPQMAPINANIIALNSDMLNFRCDWVRFMTPMIVRGKTAEDSTVWVVDVNIACHVSHASMALPN